MKSTPENAIKRKVVEILKRHNIFNWPAAASPYGVAGVSDRICVLPNGKILAIEVKAPGKKPTALQCKFLDSVKENNGYAMVVDGPMMLTELDRFLEEKGYEEAPFALRVLREASVNPQEQVRASLEILRKDLGGGRA